MLLSGIRYDEAQESKDEEGAPNGNDKDLIPVQRELRAFEGRIPIDLELCAIIDIGIWPSQKGLEEGCHGCTVSRHSQPID
jgi:hypothetical protein